MNVTISFDYVLSEWQVNYTEGKKTQIVGSGRTLKDALLNLKDYNLMHQIMIWYGMHPQMLGIVD